MDYILKTFASFCKVQKHNFVIIIEFPTFATPDSYDFTVFNSNLETFQDFYQIDIDTETTMLQDTLRLF